MKALFIGLVIAALVSAAYSAALTAGNVLILRKLGDASKSCVVKLNHSF